MAKLDINIYGITFYGVGDEMVFYCDFKGTEEGAKKEAAMHLKANGWSKSVIRGVGGDEILYCL